MVFAVSPELGALQLGQRAIADSVSVAPATSSTFATVAAQNAGNTQVTSIATRLIDQPVVNSRLRAVRIGLSNSYSASGDTTIIAAPAAGVQIVISEIILQNAVATAQTALLKRGAADTNPQRIILSSSIGSGLATAYSQGNEFRLGAATAFVLNLSAATAVSLSVRYWLETVSTGLPV